MTIGTTIATLSLPFLCICAIGATAQNVTPTVIASAGGEGQVGEITIMWTLGELAVTTLKSDGYYLTQGFHQPPDGTTNVPTTLEPIALLQVRPNPVASDLVVGIPTATAATLTLSDMLGRIVMVQEVAAGSTEVRLDLSSLPGGTYVVRLAGGAEQFGTLITVQR